MAERGSPPIAEQPRKVIADVPASMDLLPGEADLLVHYLGRLLGDVFNPDEAKSR